MKACYREHKNNCSSVADRKVQDYRIVLGLSCIKRELMVNMVITTISSDQAKASCCALYGYTKWQHQCQHLRIFKEEKKKNCRQFHHALVNPNCNNVSLTLILANKKQNKTMTELKKKPLLSHLYNHGFFQCLH